MKLVIAFAITIAATVAICQWFDAIHSFMLLSSSFTVIFTVFGFVAFIGLVLLLVVWLTVSSVEDAYWNGGVAYWRRKTPNKHLPPIVTTRLQNVDITSDPADPA